MRSETISHPFIWTAGGRRVYPADLRADQIDFESVVEGISKQPRFGGQTNGCLYTVGEHSLRVAALMAAAGWGDSPSAMLAALLHDAAEAYIGDQAKPIKLTLPDYQELESRMQQAIWTHFDLTPSPEVMAAIKYWDTRIVLTEAMSLFRESPEWVEDFLRVGVEPIGQDVWRRADWACISPASCLGWEDVKYEFTKEYNRLLNLRRVERVRAAA